MKLFWHFILLLFQKDGMPKSGPIIIIEDDMDDQELMTEIFMELQVPNLIKFFNSGIIALNYLISLIEKPFLIISDINLPAMTGLELCQQIMENKTLKNKSIPFVFLTTSGDQNVIADAYQMSIQGFFVKPGSVHELKDLVRMIIDYWKVCQHPAN